MKKRGILAAMAVTLFLSGCASNVSKGVEYLEEGKYEEAIASFQLDLEEGKNLDEANRGIAIAYFELEDYENAVNYFSEALTNDAEETASIYHLLGTSSLKLEDYDNAVKYYDKALGMEDCTDDMKKEMMFNKIAICEKAADWEGAKEAVASYLELYPDDERAIKESQFLETR